MMHRLWDNEQNTYVKTLSNKFSLFITLQYIHTHLTVIFAHNSFVLCSLYMLFHFA